MEDIQEAATRAATLTRQLLAFSRRQVIKPEVVDLSSIATGVESMLRRLIGEDIDILFDLAKDLWNVEIDVSQIEQVIVNLAVNSRDAMPQGGRLTVETRNVVLDEAFVRKHATITPGPHVLLAVTDTGTGMDDETLERAFEPFFTTKGKGCGTGLGLSMVYGIVKQNRGDIWVYSESGQGTTIKIYLPQATIEHEPKKKSAPPAGIYSRGGETILIVEDEPALRRTACRILKRYGYSVLEAQDGLEAETVSRNHQGRIDLMLTDVVMPGLSGRETAEHIIAERPGMRVLYMSGYTDNAIVHHGVLDTGTSFIEKPFTPESLAREVRVVLDDREDR